MATSQYMSFQKLLHTESGKYCTGATVFWCVVPNIKLVLVIFEIMSSLLVACDSIIADSAVKIVRFPRLQFFKIIPPQNQRNSAMMFQFFFSVDSARRAAAKKTGRVTRITSNFFSALATSTASQYFSCQRRSTASCPSNFHQKVYGQKRYGLYYQMTLIQNAKNVSSICTSGANSKLSL